jgi:hypothetical protein
MENVFRVEKSVTWRSLKGKRRLRLAGLTINWSVDFPPRMHSISILFAQLRIEIRETQTALTVIKLDI